MRAVPYYEFQQYNPACPVDWRWRRALHLVQHQRYASTKRDDKLTCRAVHFLRALNRARSRRARSGLARSMPRIHAAYQLRTGAWQHRLEIEGRLLASQPPEEIAAAVGTMPEVIDLFHDLFFDVSDQIDDTDYVTKMAIWKGTRAGGRDHTAESFVRALAYFGGTTILDVVLPCFGGSAGGGRQPPEIVASSSRQYENTRRLLDLYAEFTSEQHTSGSLQKPPVAPTDRHADSGEAYQKPGELVRSGALQGDKRTLKVVELADPEVDIFQQEVMQQLHCEVG